MSYERSQMLVCKRCAVVTHKDKASIHAGSGLGNPPGFVLLQCPACHDVLAELMPDSSLELTQGTVWADTDAS